MDTKTGIIFSNDSGNSSSKVIAFDVLRPMQPAILTLDALAHPLGVSDIPGSISSSMLLQPVRGIYGATARQHGAQFFKEPNYTGDVHQLLKYGALADALELLAPGEEFVTVKVWVEGFPATHIGRGKDVEAMLLNGGKPFIVQKDGRPAVHVKVDQVLTQSQPHFMAIDQVFRWEGNRLTDTRGKELFAGGAVLIIDWGASSIDIALATSSLRDIKADCSMSGTISFLSALREMAFNKTNDNIPDYELMQAYKTKKLLWRGRDYDFSDEIGQLITRLIPAVVNRTDAFLKQYSDYFVPYTLLLGGGGVVHAEMALREVFHERFQDTGGIHLVKDDAGNPETAFSVVRGMAKRGFLAWQAQK